MGTFHQNLGDLHGVTVAVRTHDRRAIVGRCHEAGEKNVIMIDVAVHTDGDDGLSADQFVKRAAKWGVFKQHDHLVIDRQLVDSITPLNQIQP